MTEKAPRKFLSVEEAAAECGVSPWLIRKLCKEGRIPHTRAGDRVLIATDWEKSLQKE